MKFSAIIIFGLILTALHQAGCVPEEAQTPAGRQAPTVDVPAIRQKLLAEQKSTYPQLRDGRYMFLADFEPYSSLSQARQVECFSLAPAGPAGSVGLNSKIQLTGLLQRTGQAALSVTLDPNTALVYQPANMQSKGPRGVGSVAFVTPGRAYTLLSLAVLSGTVRDDLRVTLISGKGRWTSGPTLLKAGWNQVLIDIQRLGQLANFDASDIRAIRLRFISSADPVTFTLDDLVLIDNYARIIPVPRGFFLLRNGLDYALKLPAPGGTVGLRQSDDGLWRLGVGQPVVQLFPPGTKAQATAGEKLGLMGPNRLGRVIVEEHNRVRIRISNTWLFPSRAGQWAPVGVRYLRWVYTIYPDGRWVTDIQLDNAGGQAIGRVNIFLPTKPGLWAGRSSGLSDHREVEDFIGPTGRWNYLQLKTALAAGEDSQAAILQRNYLHPGRLDVSLGQADRFAPGDAERDGFDESQGCYFLASSNGQCRFRIIPPAAGLMNPVFRVAGPWRRQPCVNVEGLALRGVSLLPDGSAVLTIAGKITKPTFVEVLPPTTD